MTTSFCDRFLVATVCLLPIVACQSAAPRAPVAGLHNPDDIAVNREQLRLRMRALVGPLTAKVESAADDIAAASTDRAVQEAALDWKIEAVPAMREALFIPSPSLALMDAWVLAHQMSDYFVQGPGRTRLGAFSGQAAAASQALEADLARVAASATTSRDVSAARNIVRQWAADHPITGTIGSREPVLSGDFRTDVSDSLRVGEAAAEIAVTLDDLNRKLASYSSQLPRQARWEVDRQKRDLLDGAASSMRATVPLAERTVVSVEQLAGAIDRMPDVISGERRAAVGALSAELNRTIAFIQEERLAALAYLTSERKATMEDLHKALLAEQSVLGTEIGRLSARTIDQTMDRMERFVWRLVAAIVAAVLAGIALVRVLFGRPAVIVDPFRAST
jgi:cell division septum initiation protein DivIVA